MKKSIKKSISRFLTMLMAVMMLSISVMARPMPSDLRVAEQATTQIKATVRIANETDLPTYPVVELIVLDKENFKTLFPVEDGAVHQYQDIPTVMDALYQYLLDQGIPLEEGIKIGWDIVSKVNGAYINEFIGTETNVVDAYYSSVKGQSYWKGYSWGLYVNGMKTELYASNLILNEGDIIDLIYEYTEEYW